MMRLNDRRLLAQLVVVAVCLFSGAATSVHASAQPQQGKCPTTRVSCPDMVNAGEPLTMTANVSGGDPNVTPTYNWTVSAGTISSGQGTSTITVDTTSLTENSSVTATVELGGFDRECGYGSTVGSCTTSVMKKPEARKFDEYGALKPADENARLDNFATEMMNDPTAQAYVIAYGGRSGQAGSAQKAADRAKAYLVTRRGLNAQRVVTLDGGYREQALTELWIAPSGAQPPQPTPTVKPAATKPAGPAKPTAPKKTPARKKA
jgi:PKD-like domain